MSIVDIINKKRLDMELTKEELEFAFLGYKDKKIKDYQMSSLLMAISINGLNDREVFDLVEIFINSGKTMDLSRVSGVKVDKHSTGGVGDKTTLVVAPIVASLGIKVPKMSGRGLGYTGGTIDKLESIPGIKVDFNEGEFLKALEDVGMVICSQTADLVPMDKEIYSLRDVTATVESIPLIAISIMSKKIASGADNILIDIKVGKGSLIKNERDAKLLRDLMIRIGDLYKKEVRCIISDMNIPLGMCIGNALEVAEAAEILYGRVKNNLYELCVEISSNMVSMALEISIIDAREKVIEAIENKTAYSKFLEFIKYQKGNLDAMLISSSKIEILSTKKGIITGIDAHKVSEVSSKLGSGKLSMEDVIDHSVGVFLNKHVGDSVEIGELLCTLYYNKVKDDFSILEAFTIT